MGDKRTKHCQVVSRRCEKPLQQEVICHIFVLERSLPQLSTEKGFEGEMAEKF